MPVKAKHKIIIDTNLWISFLLTGNYSKIDNLIANNQITLLFSQELLDEFIEVVHRPKFKKYFSANHIEALLQKMSTKAECITITSTINQCRDPKDNFLLALAQDGNATHLITGDHDLLVIKKIGRTQIISISQYLKIIKHSQ